MTAVRLTPEQIWGLDLIASRRRQRSGGNETRADVIREAIHKVLLKEGVIRDTHLS